MNKKRAYISRHIRRLLLIESGNKCSMPRCTHETGLEIHHIDSDPENNEFGNLLLLCSVHHSQVTKGQIDKQTCYEIKATLAPDLCPRRPESMLLTSRRELVEEAIRCLEARTESYRTMTVGPLLLHPDWWVERRNMAVQIPDYDRHLKRFVFENGHTRNHNIRFIFTNSERYKQKAERFLKVNERSRFQVDLLQAIEDLWGEGGKRGPDLCCINTGFAHIEMIFDDARIVTHRAAPNVVTTGGIVHYGRESVERGISRFDSIFDTSSKGQGQEISALKKIIAELW